MSTFLVRGDARRLPLATGSVQAIVTSPPYFGLRSYGGQTSVWGGDPECGHGWTPVSRSPAQQGGWSEKQASNQGAWHHGTDVATCTRCGAWRGELGSEPTPALFVAHLVEVMRECWRVLRDDGVAFVNMGSSYAGSGKGPTGHNGIGNQGKRQGFVDQRSDGGIRQKSDMLIPQRLAIALSDDGWIIRQVLIWAKNNPMPESVRDRWTTAHEYVLMLVKQPRYFFDQAAIREDFQTAAGENYPARSKVLGRGNQPSHGAHPSGPQLDASGGYPPNPAGRNGRSVWNVNSEPGAKGVRSTKRVRVSADDTSYDTERTTSGACPIHGDHPDSTVQHDGLLDGSPNHTTRNGTDHAQEQLSEAAPIVDQSSAEWGQAPFFDLAELPHSTPSSRTDQSESTNSACSASSETPYRTADRSASPEHGSQHPDMGGSSTSAGSERCAQDSDPSARTAGRTSSKETSAADVQPSLPTSPFDEIEPSTSSNRTEPLPRDTSEQTLPDTTRTSSCTCTYHRVIIQETQHFAQFPREIPRRCILAATSEHGACAACGAAWKRVVEKSANPYPGSSHDHTADLIGPGAQRHANGTPSGTVMWKRWLEQEPPKHTGWQPTCKCGLAAGVRPCVVLDPFSGSGTTPFVAASMGRIGIGVELSAEYTEQARLGRLAQQFLPLAPESPAPAALALDAAPARQGGLFEEVGIA